MPNTLWGLAATAVTFWILDALWLGLLMKNFYRSRLGGLLREQPQLLAVAAFYLLYVVGIFVFAVRPAIATGGCLRAALLGALFGFFAYMTYDLTNLATLRGWSLSLALVDIAWGALASGAAAAAGCWAATR